jgi:PIN domain nuclease of toxin-antitoxin system
MSLLLDSHALLWALHAPGRMRPGGGSGNPGSSPRGVLQRRVGVGARAKAVKGKLVLPRDWLRTAEATGFLQIPVTAAVAQTSARLPWHHSDPFDRVLIAQAMEHGLEVATRDAVIGSYGVPVLDV